MAVSKVVLGDETLVDLTSDTVSENTLLEGATAHAANGEQITGGVVVTPMYTGTKAAIEEAIALGQIPEDAVVNITDDEEASSFQAQINEINNSLGNVSDITNDTYNNIVALINYWQSKGELSDPTKQALIPTMTSDSYPSGVSSCSSRYNTSDYYAYLAFDGTNKKWNSSKTGTSEWIQYKFENPVNAKKITYTNVTDGTHGAQNSGIFKFQVSSDGSNWIDVSENITQSNGSITFKSTEIQYIRCQQTGGSEGLAVEEIQVYGSVS